MTNTRGGLPPGVAIIRALSRIVPGSSRDDWRAEWIAELTHAWRDNDVSEARLRLRALGAVADALWLRRNRADHSRLESTMLAHDVRFAARTLLRRPAFTTIVVATLALCIGASSAVFSIVESVLLRGLSYRDLDRLVAVWSNNPKEKNDRYQVSVGDYYDWRQRSRSFEQLAGFFPIWNATYTAPDVAERLSVGAVTANFLGTLGVRPLIGRDFVDGEDRPGAPQVAILSHAFWSRFFHDDASALGKVVNLDGQPYVVAGVMPPEFTFPQNKVDLIVPLPILGSYLDRREVHLLSVIGRLRAGITIERARRDLAPITAQIVAEHPKDDAGLGVTVNPLTDDLLGDVRRPILVLFAAVCAVLLIGCANVANLMLSRATGRRQELAVRMAMGAEPGTIARQLLTESALIASTSGVLGIGLAFAVTRAIANLLPESIGRIGQVRVDGSVLGFTSIVCIIVALLCGIAPAIRGARGATRDALTDAARGSSRGRRARRLHSVLVVAELALALVLTVSAGLLVNSFARLTRTDPGFRTDHLVRMKIALPSATYPRGAKRDQFFESLLREAATLPGVQSAGFVSRFPLHDGHLTTGVLVEGAPYAERDQLPSAEYRLASAGYFKTMGTPILAGREFESSDKADSTSLPVAVINRAASIRFFGVANAVGKRLSLSGPKGPYLTVIGVVGDVHTISLREAPLAEVYLSSRQGLPSAGSIVVRYAAGQASIVSGVRRIVTSLDKTLPVFDVQSVEEVMAAASVSERFTTTVLSSFAILALVLAALGTYGVVAYGVAERTREIGVRMALGARAAQVLTMVLREGMLMFAVALPIALLAVWWTNRALTSLLFAIPASDPATIVSAVFTLGAVTAVACYIPARRAAHVDPTIAIRGESAV
jgi:putative ABC transport system permease protein